MRAAITLQRGDPHFGEDFEQPFVDGLLVIFERFFESDARRKVALGGLVLQRFDGEIRIHGACAIADQEREVHDLAWLAGFDNQGDLRTRAFAHQMIVNG